MAGRFKPRKEKPARRQNRLTRDQRREVRKAAVQPRAKTNITLVKTPWDA